MKTTGLYLKNMFSWDFERAEGFLKVDLHWKLFQNHHLGLDLLGCSSISFKEGNLCCQNGFKNRQQYLTCCNLCIIPALDTCFQLQTKMNKLDPVTLQSKAEVCILNGSNYLPGVKSERSKGQIHV